MLLKNCNAKTSIINFAIEDNNTESKSEMIGDCQKILFKSHVIPTEAR